MMDEDVTSQAERRTSYQLRSSTDRSSRENQSANLAHKELCIHTDPLQLFKGLIISARQRDGAVERSLQYELTPFPLSLFSNRDQMMNKANKAEFSNKTLKALIDPLDSTKKTCSTLVIDGGWLLHRVEWEQRQTWQQIANNYLSYVQDMGRLFKKIVVFDGYKSSPKDHDHIRRTKNSCPNIHIRPVKSNWISREQFLSNTQNKTELINLLSSTFQKHDITVKQCDDDADTSIVGQALTAALNGSVEVRAEDADVLVMLVHHSSDSHQPLFLTTSKGSYDVRSIKISLSETQKKYLLFCHAFTGCDTVSAIAGRGKSSLFSRFCEWDAAGEYIDIFLDRQATKEAVIHGGTAIFKWIYDEKDTTLGKIRYNMFSTKAAELLKKPKKLPPTEGAAAQHSLRAYLQIQDWIRLQSMSLDPIDYGWRKGVHGYEPVPTLASMAPDELLQFTSCNCHGDRNSLRYSCKKNGVTCILACESCEGLICKNGSQDDAQSEEGIDNDC